MSDGLIIILAGVLMVGSLLAPYIFVIMSSIKELKTYEKALEGDEEAIETMHALASLYEVPVRIVNKENHD